MDKGNLESLVNRSTRRNVLKWTGFAALAAAVPPVLAACGSSGNASPTATATSAVALPATPAAAVAVASVTPLNADLYVSILTGGMIGKKDWPAFVPSSFQVPANATVTVHVLNFDDPDDMSADTLVQYTKVTGLDDNTVTVQPISDDTPNKLGSPQKSAQLDPKAGVSHTITFTDLGVNVPIAPHAWTTFTIKTSAAGSHAWECKVPCGTGPGNIQGAMVADGYMEGTMTVV